MKWERSTTPTCNGHLIKVLHDTCCLYTFVFRFFAFRFTIVDASVLKSSFSKYHELTTTIRLYHRACGVRTLGVDEQRRNRPRNVSKWRKESKLKENPRCRVLKLAKTQCNEICDPIFDSWIYIFPYSRNMEAWRKQKSWNRNKVNERGHWKLKVLIFYVNRYWTHEYIYIFCRIRKPNIFVGTEGKWTMPGIETCETSM